ncbi:hypothetical protein HNGLIVSP_CDS0115 [Escherichia phage 241]|nr:hypothetical protein HNGLIVSP_CDS0115 [Escherichia phage 241]
MIGETRFLFKCTEQGLTVSQPFGDNAPYDFVLDIEGRLYKVQCKTLLQDKASFILDASSTNYYNGKCKSVYHSDVVDLYYGYHPETCTEVLVDPKQYPKNVRLRVTPPKNNQVVGVKWLKDFLFDEVIQEIRTRQWV